MIANPVLQGGSGKQYTCEVGGQKFDFVAGMTWTDMARNYPESFQVRGDSVLHQNQLVLYPTVGSFPVPAFSLVSNISYPTEHSGGSN